MVGSDETKSVMRINLLTAEENQLNHAGQHYYVILPRTSPFHSEQISSDRQTVPSRGTHQLHHYDGRHLRS